MDFHSFFNLFFYSAYDNHQQPMEYYKAISWGGLESSSIYQALPNKTDIQKIINNERYAKSDAKGTKWN